MRADPVLLDRLPSPRRVLGECALVVTLVFLPALAVSAGTPRLGRWPAAGLAFAAWAAAAAGFTRRRPGAALAAVLGVAAVVWTTVARDPGVLPRLSGADLASLLLRSLAVMAVVAALLAADGQSARHIGLEPSRLGRELAWGGPVLAGAFVVHVAVTLPVAAVMFATGMAQGEAAQRLGSLQGLLAGASLWQLVPALLVLAAFEEVVFRGFLLPRARRLTGRWWLAVAAVQLLFGLGHLYEGVFAVTQTMLLGVYFSAAFLWRTHLGAPIAAHAAFNTIMFTLVLVLQRSGLLERLPQLK
jgi:uncharacterized protein